jgi:hypothetical protein
VFCIYWDDESGAKETKRDCLDGYISKCTQDSSELGWDSWLLKQIPMKINHLCCRHQYWGHIDREYKVLDISVDYMTAKLSFDNGLLNVENETIAQFLAD